MRRTFTMQLYDQPAQRSVATIIAELAAATGTDEREVAAAIQSMIQADNAAKNAANNMGLQREPGELDISFRSRVRIDDQVANMVLGPPNKSKAQSLTEAMRTGGVPATPEDEQQRMDALAKYLEEVKLR